MATAVAALGCRDPLGPLAPFCEEAAKPVRVRGRVLEGDRGLSGVAVTDGLTVTVSGVEGEFELLSNSHQPYVYITVPQGYAIPCDEAGTARFYQPLASCLGPDEIDVAFRLGRLEGSGENHTMILVADPQVADEADVARMADEATSEFVSLAGDLSDENAFVVTCGDVVFGAMGLARDYVTAMSAVGVPMLYVMGNHDFDGGYTAGDLKAQYRQLFGPTYYSFDRGEIHYVVLDNVFMYQDGYFGYVPEAQLRWLRADLALVESGKTVVICQHIPMLGTRHTREGRVVPHETLSVANRDDIYRLLEGYSVHVVAGHGHEADHLLTGQVHEHLNGALCGAWWTGPVCPDGTPNGYSIYEARGSEVRWRYKATGLPAETQMWLHPPGSDPGAPRDIIANVWFWDPAWTVRWYEDGQPRGLMTRRLGRDPVARGLYEGADLPSRYGWVEPFPTNHLFRATPALGTARVVVEATDRFGNVFTAHVDLA